MQSTTPKLVSRAFALAAALAVAITGILVWSLMATRVHCQGTFALGICDGKLEIANASDALSRQGPGWVLITPTARPAVMVGPKSGWRPTTSVASISVTDDAGTNTLTLSVHYVPLWPWALGLTGVSVWLWCRMRRTVPVGCCARCGYDLKGFRGDRCPECGETALQSRFTEMLRRILRPLKWTGSKAEHPC